MKPKVLHKNLACITREWIQQSPSPDLRDSIQQLTARLTQLLDERSTFQEERRATNAKIGKQRSAGSAITDLIDRVKALSAEIKGLDTLIDDATSRLLALQPTVKSISGSSTSQSSESVLPEEQPGIPGQFLAHQFVDTISHLPSDASVQTVQITECTDGAAWDAYIAQHPRSTHYHQHPWRDLIDRNFGHRSFYFQAQRSDGHVSGVLPVVHMKSRLFGSFLLSMPWLIYGGALADDHVSHDAIGNHLKQLMIERQCSHVDLREVHPRDGWIDVPGKVAMVLSLPDNHDIFNTSLGSKLRAQIKRAARERPTIEFGGSALVPEFYRVFSEKMRDLGTPVFNRGFFEDIANTFPDSATFVVVRVEGKPAAAACLLGFRNTLEVPWAAACKRYNKAGINMFMYHAILEEAITRGYQCFDFGRSTVGESTYRFKAQWGAKAYALGWLRYTAESGEDDAGKPGRAMLLASSVWKRMPLVMTNFLGPRIAGKLPW